MLTVTDNSTQSITATLLCKHRKIKKMSIQDLSKRSQVPAQVISDIESQKRTAKIPELLQIADVLEVSFADLWNERSVRNRVVFCTHATVDSPSAQIMKNMMIELLEMDDHLICMGY